MMIVSLAMIGGSTTLIGFLPTYEQVGLAAPIMLLTLRLVQVSLSAVSWVAPS